MDKNELEKLIDDNATSNLSKWSRVRLTIPIDKVGQTITPLLNITRAWLGMVVTLLRIIKNFLVGIPDPTAAAIYAACEAIKTAIDTLLKNNPVYVLLIPPTFEDPQIYTNNLAQDSELPPLVSGGNARFVSQIYAALDDTEDTYRPQFGPDAYVGGIILLAGAQTYTELVPLLQSLQKLLSGQQWDWPTELSNTNIAIQNLSYDITIGNAEVVTGKIGVRLHWNPIATVHYIDGVAVARVVKLQIKRRELAREATDEQIFDVSSPYADTYLDISAAPGKTYLYSLNAYDSEDTLLATERIVVTTPPVEECRFHSNQGVPPNWYAAPGIFYFFPELIKALYQIRNWAESVENAIADPLEKYKKAIEDAAENIETYAKNIDAILKKLKEIAELLSIPETLYLGMYSFAAQGGNDAIKQSLSQAFGNFNDPNRPPFDSDDALTTGMVIVTGGSTGIEYLQDTLLTFFETTPTEMQILQQQIKKEFDARKAQTEAEIKILENLLAAEE